MNKEYLEAFNYILYSYYAEEIKSTDDEAIVKNLNILQTALNRLESIDNAKPNEALECLKSLDIQVRFMGILDIPSWEKYLPTIKKALIKAQKKEKVLEIIKEKRVDIFFLQSCETLEKYNLNIIKNCKFTYGLTKEEFDLLKRWAE